jgi:hypothetical protein
MRSGLLVIHHVRHRLCGKLGILLRNPLLDELPKRVSLLHELANLGFRGHIRRIIIKHVALPAAGLKIAYERRYTPPHRQLHGFKGGDVMSLSHDTLAGTGNRHLRKLQDGIVSRGKLAVRREARHLRIAQVTRDDGPQAVEFLAAGRVSLHPVGGEELPPSHADPLRQRASPRQVRPSGSGARHAAL